MKYFIGAAALLTATASAQSGCVNDGGNYYCNVVSAITYTSVGGFGSYDKITNMDSSSGSCQNVPFGYQGSLAPLDEPVSWHIRGPTNLKQFAAYTPGEASTKKRSEHLHRHRYGDSHHHKRHEHQRRAVGDMVTATIDGVVQSWVDEYNGVSTPSSVASAPAYGVSSAAPSGSAPAYTSSAPAAESSRPSTSSSGGWGRNAYYSSDNKSSDGLVFLNYYGGSGSGTFDYSFGNSLSFASCDGTSGASSPQVLEDTTLPSSAEVVIMTDTKCSGDSCGYTRPGTVAYEGFD